MTGTALTMLAVGGAFAVAEPAMAAQPDASVVERVDASVVEKTDASVVEKVDATVVEMATTIEYG